VFGVWCLVFGVWCLGFGVWGFGVCGLGLELRVQGSGVGAPSGLDAPFSARWLSACSETRLSCIRATFVNDRTAAVPVSHKVF